eukprot:14474351-Alexandrium_andersonii.AAC.1
MRRWLANGSRVSCPPGDFSPLRASNAGVAGVDSLGTFPCWGALGGLSPRGLRAHRVVVPA